MVIDAIEAADADLICFQETTEKSERFLRKRLAMTHPHFHAIGHEGKYAAERFAFASNRRLTDLSFVPPTAGIFGFYAAKVKFAGGIVHIVNVHLTPLVLKQSDGALDAMAALSKTEDRHAIEIETVIDAMDPLHPTIILGDFNSISSFKAPQRLIKLGLIDAFACRHDDADTHPTWTWPTRPLPLNLRIDYIFSHAAFCHDRIKNRAA